MQRADRIRTHVLERYVEPARSRGDETVSVIAKEVLRDLELRGDCAPSVCSALRALKFRKDNDLELIREDGPPSKQSTTTSFTYRILRRSTKPDDRRPRNAVRDLLGAGKETFAALGGGENWLRREREEFYGVTGDAVEVGRHGGGD